ncbi:MULTISPECIES: E2/E1-associated domain-containing protein [Cyanophyceae]|uniref:E2/E1-associated domain-containing protein n=1 Tax=Cyanophyceae TaxID=3028117 RepID=UPI0002A66990|nr:MULTISPECIES: E2/E1-associated domain-containing protein [Cyanophyceae]AFZ33579.1 UBA/THIF-type NAD/FAD binding protein [Gloeocapsa sp. PCC 7428]PPS42081.1 thiamine biosynthesis protein ThiF [Chroococcidiopsis sp. TS-821]
MSDIWFISDLQRLVKEREAICLLEDSVDWLTGTNWILDNGRLVVEAIIQAHGYDYPVKMVYPALFPAVPPTVYPKNSEERWSSHQYVSGALCLEWRPDTWHTEVTGAQVLESTYTLLSTENPRGTGEQHIVPSQHELSTGQILRESFIRVYVNKALNAYLAGLSSFSTGSIEFSGRWQSQSYLVLLYSVQPDDLPAWNDTLIPKRLNNAAKNRGAFYKTGLPPKALATTNTLQDLEAVLEQAGYGTAALKEHSIWVEKDAGGLFGVLLTDAEDNLHFFLKIAASKSEVWKATFVQSNLDTINPRLPSELHELSSKSVGIVGLGSVGSKVAASIARTGVGKFYLVDEDIFLPENICRNDLDWRNVGEHKVHAVAEVMSYITATAQVDVATLSLGGQESSAALDCVLRQLNRCDLLIDATANPIIFNLLAFIAKSYAKPLVWAEVFAGGIGGMIARSRPGQDPDLQATKAAFHEYLSMQDVALPGTATDQYILESTGGEVLEASDAEVSIMAGHLTRLAIDTLLAREPSLFPYSIYVIGFQQAWIFKAPFHTIPIDTSKVVHIESGNPVSPDVDSEGIDFLSELLEKMQDADSPS